MQRGDKRIYLNIKITMVYIDEFMLWLVALSFNAVYTLIPIIIIVVLIGAGAGLSRNTDFFALMGFGTLMGAVRPGGSVGKGFKGAKYGGGKAKRGRIKKHDKKKPTRIKRVKGLIKKISAKHAMNVKLKSQAKANLGIKAANDLHNAGPQVKKPATQVQVKGMKNSALTALTLGRINMATSHARKLKGAGPQTKYGIYGQKLADSKVGENLRDARNARNAAVKKLNESYRKQADFKESLISKTYPSGKPKSLSDKFKDSDVKSEELKKSLVATMLKHPVIFGAVSLPAFLAARYSTKAGKQRRIDMSVEKNKAIVAKKIRNEEKTRSDANYMLFKSSMPSKKEARTAFKNEYKKLKSEYNDIQKAEKEVKRSKKEAEVNLIKSQAEDYYKNMTWTQMLKINAIDRWNYNKAPIFDQKDKQKNPSILGSHYEKRINNMDESQINKLNDRLNKAHLIRDTTTRVDSEKEALGIAMLSKRKQKKYERLEEKETNKSISSEEKKTKDEIGLKAAAIIDRRAKAIRYQFHPEINPQTNKQTNSQTNNPQTNQQTGSNKKPSQPKMTNDQFKKDFQEKRNAEADLKAKEYYIDKYKKQLEKIEHEKQENADEERRMQEEKQKKAQKKSNPSSKPNQPNPPNKPSKP